MLETLWHAYNPGALSDGGVREQRQRRFAEILDSGAPTTPYTATITDDEIERAVGEAADDGLALRRLLAPRSWEERDDQVVINDGIAASTYFVDNFSYDLMPSLSRILGEYAGRLHVAMYVRAPERAEVVERARKATVARQASEMVRGAYGQIQSYKAAQEITATEDLRARAEMGLETPRFLGMYLMLFACGSEELAKLRPKFESHLRNQGVRLSWPDGSRKPPSEARSPWGSAGTATATAISPRRTSARSAPHRAPPTSNLTGIITPFSARRARRWRPRRRWCSTGCAAATPLAPRRP